MANENDSKLQIISECFIRPNCEVEQSKNIHYLSPYDLFQLSAPYMHRGLLYAKPTSFDIKSLVDKLKRSLSRALIDFYPLAGRLVTVKYEDEHVSWVYVDCNEGPGARFIHAQAKLSVTDVIDSSQYIGCLFDGGDSKVVNHDGHTRALTSVQVTDLVDGVFIGVTVNHSLGDGVSTWFFINSLSKIFIGQEDNIEKPIFKAVFADGYGPVIKIPHLDPSEIIARSDVDPRLTIRIFHFTAASIAKLKALANANNNNNMDTISSFQALSALVWISITRARKLPLESDTCSFLMANMRPKLDPPLGSNHFQNLARAQRAATKVNELMNNGLGWAAMLIHKAVVGLTKQVITDSINDLSKSPKVAPLISLLNKNDSNPPLLFTGSMRFDEYGPEFGLGKALATRSGHPSWSNGLIVTHPGREGDGSADLQICLTSEAITALETDLEFMSYVS